MPNGTTRFNTVCRSNKTGNWTLYKKLITGFRDCFFVNEHIHRLIRSGEPDLIPVRIPSPENNPDRRSRAGIEDLATESFSELARSQNRDDQRFELLGLDRLHLQRLFRCFVRRNQMLEIHFRFIDLSLSSTVVNLLLQKNWFLILLFSSLYYLEERLSACTF